MPKRIGLVEVAAECCKGCGLCVAECPTGSLRLGSGWNRLGYPAVEFVPGTGCTGCAVCFYACPEPAALRVSWVERAA